MNPTLLSLAMEASPTRSARTLPINLVAADVRRLHLNDERIGASPRRLLPIRASTRAFLSALCAVAFVALTGCNKEPSATSAPPQPRTTPETNAAFAFDLPEPKLSEADQAWRDFAKSMQEPPVPASWKTNPPAEIELKAFRGDFAAQSADRIKDFYTRFPDHAMAPVARQQELSLLGMAVQNGQTNRQAALLALEDARLKNPDLTEDERLQLRVGQVQRHVLSLQGDNMSPALDAMEKGVRTLQKEFPARAELAGLLLGVAQGRLENGETDKSRALAQEARASEADEVEEGAQALLKKIGRVGKPLDLTFKAVDGREVDLQKLRGKVVLIDFWATWCGPCMAELPKLKETYARLHAKGFEIVGISLDEDGEALQKTIQKEAMTWPQYREEAGQENKFAAEYGIESIPTMWLVDKKGVLRDLNARAGLSAKVEKLLAE